MSDTNKNGLIPIRNIRVPEDRWNAAKTAARDRGETVSAAVNRFLDEYASQDANVIP